MLCRLPSCGDPVGSLSWSSRRAMAKINSCSPETSCGDGAASVPIFCDQERRFEWAGVTELEGELDSGLGGGGLCFNCCHVEGPASVLADEGAGYAPFLSRADALPCCPSSLLSDIGCSSSDDVVVVDTCRPILNLQAHSQYTPLYQRRRHTQVGFDMMSALRQGALNEV